MTSLRRASAAAWSDAHRGVEREVLDEVTLEPIEGSVPRSLLGALYRCGPGRLAAYGETYRHLFDGDGHVCRFAFEAGVVRFSSRFVRTREFVEESAAGRQLYRSFGSNKPGGVRRNAFDPIFKNAANTSAFAHEGRLYALWEAGLPHRLDPATLKTVGRDTFEGRLLAREDAWTKIAGRELPFSAHPRVDPATKELFNFGLANGPRQRLLLYRADDRGRMRPPEEHRLDALYFVHDFALTARFRVLFLCPARFDVLRTMLGLATPVSGMKYERSRPTRVWLVPREGGAPIVVDAPSCFVFHHVNAFDASDGTVRCHALRSDSLPTLAHPWDQDALSVAPPRDELPYYTEFVIDPTARTVTSTRRFETPCELPFVAPSTCAREHRYAWATATDRQRPMQVFTRLVKFDLREGSTIEREFAPGFPGEPVFVPKEDGGRGDDGWILAMGYSARARRSALTICDARTLEIMCTVPLPVTVPPGFHGCWVQRAP
jgi:all-trans-8'-apo-beta-carotenal 15,15'-oxygenase